MNELLGLSATRLAALIRRREVSSREVVEAHIARIEEVNPVLNALVEDRFAMARVEADAADRRVLREAADSLPPFLGVPCTIKEAIALRGMPFTAGHVAMAGRIADRDAPAVQRLRRAGFIPLGVSNASELCMWMETDNRLYGRTRNPYDPGRTTGGSSGGEGALVGAGASPVGLGADIGGSIRMPAFFNGVFGHKATGGLIPNSGNYPIAHGDALRMMTTGPLTRRAEDLWPLIRLLAGPDAVDPECRAMSLGDPSTVDPGSLNVLVVEHNGLFPVHPELRSALRRAASHLKSLGATISVEEIPEFRDSILIWASMLSEAGGPTYAERLGLHGPVSAAWATLQFLVGLSPYTLPSIGLLWLERLAASRPAERHRCVEQGRRLREDLRRRLGPRGVMLFPPYPDPAPPHNRPLIPPFQWLYTGIINALEMPAVSVPMGFGSDGLPLGVQVVATHANDHLCVAVAEELERAFGGWVMPGPLRPCKPVATRTPHPALTAQRPPRGTGGFSGPTRAENPIDPR